jgi:ABC-type uncharacterized transport system YnjBCD substrate-binding protein
MTVLNLTPHSVQVFSAEQFVNLEQVNPTTWVADSVEGEPLANYESQGVARISTSTAPKLNDSLAGQVVETVYGEITGLEMAQPGDTLIVSLPTKSMATAAGLVAAKYMVSPYKVVRSRANGSVVLGCMGFTC